MDYTIFLNAVLSLRLSAAGRCASFRAAVGVGEAYQAMTPGWAIDMNSRSKTPERAGMRAQTSSLMSSMMSLDGNEK